MSIFTRDFFDCLVQLPSPPAARIMKDLKRSTNRVSFLRRLKSNDSTIPKQWLIIVGFRVNAKHVNLQQRSQFLADVTVCQNILADVDLKTTFDLSEVNLNLQKSLYTDCCVREPGTRGCDPRVRTYKISRIGFQEIGLPRWNRITWFEQQNPPFYSVVKRKLWVRNCSCFVEISLWNGNFSAYELN